MTKPENYDEIKRIVQKAYDDGRAGKPFEPNPLIASHYLQQWHDKGLRLAAIQRRIK